MSELSNEIIKIAKEIEKFDENRKSLEKATKKLNKDLMLKTGFLFIISAFFLKYLLKLKSSILVFKESVLLTKMVGITTTVIIGTTGVVTTIDYQVAKQQPILLDIPIDNLITETVLFLENELEKGDKEKKIVVMKRKEVDNKFRRGKLLKVTLRDGTEVSGTVIKKTQTKLILLIITPKKERKTIDIDFIWRISYD